jgi:hypothetical protein
VQAFQSGRYEAALVEFRFVERAGAPPDLGFYLGPTLHKLGRHAEAAEVLLALAEPRDTLAELYLAQALYQQRLFLAARRSFAGLRGRLGPRLDAVAERYVALIDGLYAAAPPASVASFYLLGATREGAEGRPRLAELFQREAEEVRTRAQRSP